MSKILVTFVPLRPLGFCKYPGGGVGGGGSNYLLGIGYCTYAGIKNMRLTLSQVSTDPTTLHSRLLGFLLSGGI